MRISDWSSDVCSSDLIALRLRELAAQLLVQRVEPRVLVVGGRRAGSGVIALLVQLPLDVLHLVPDANDVRVAVGEIQQQSVELGLQLDRSEEHTSELQSLMRISYAVFCLKKKNTHTHYNQASKNQQHNLSVQSVRNKQCTHTSKTGTST